MGNDYISREAAEERLNRLERESYHNSVLWPDHVEECREAIRDIPAADVRPVVYCRDCENAKHWYSDKYLCYLWIESGIDVFADGFCFYGKRRGAKMGGTDGRKE